MSEYAYPSPSTRRFARGFTLIEVSIVVIIIALLAGVLIVGVRHAMSAARDASERQALNSLRIGVEQFRQQYGFLPPLVVDDKIDDPADQSPPPRPMLTGANPQNIAVWPADELAKENPSNALHGGQRYSIFSLPIYLMGTADKSIDGVDGAGSTEPRRDGTFSRRGRTYEPLFDGSKPQNRLVLSTSGEQTRLFDYFSRRLSRPIRYYRWTPIYYTKTTAPTPDLVGQVNKWNVPALLGNPESDVTLRGAEFAIISAGPDGLFGDESSLGSSESRLDAMKDNLVEVGK